MPDVLRTIKRGVKGMVGVGLVAGFFENNGNLSLEGRWR